MFTDTHCHLYKEYYENIDLVIERAKSKGIVRFFNCGVDANTNKEVLSLSKKYDNVYPAIGIHPENAHDYSIDDIKYIEDNINNVIAIGEIGLDYHYDGFNKEKQIELFELQLELAEKYNKPVLIHNRKATDDILKILKKHKVRGIMHCFDGSIELANEFIKLGFLLGYNGVCTFKDSKSFKVMPNINVNNIVLETDSPYLTPEPYKKEKNEPKYIKEIALYVSKTMSISIEELSEITNNNIKRIFDI